MPGLFISHASADKELVDDFVDSVVRLGFGVQERQFFYSSGRGVPSGEDLSAFIRKKARESNLVIALITPAFTQSAYCIAELGAAWATAGALFPLLHPALTHDDLDGVLRGVAARTLNDPSALDELFDRVVAALDLEADSQQWGRYKPKWLASVEALDQLPVVAGAIGLAPPAATSTSNVRASANHAGPPVNTIGAVNNVGAAVNNAGAFQWGDLFDSFVDAAMYIKDEELARTAIEGHILAGSLIPSRYHYASDSGAANWLRLCAEPTYGYHIHTTDFWADAHGREVAQLVLETLDTDVFDFVSLGPGDGQKDADIVANWMQDDADVLYYPYDVSLPLASRAVQQVCERANNLDTGKLRVKAVLADFGHFGTMRRVFSHRAAPNVIALLGSLGNLDNDIRFLRNLKNAIGPKDLVLIEVRLQSDARELVTASSLEHDFGPLAYYLGLEYDAERMSVERHPRFSQIAGTETVVVKCRQALGKGQPEREISLQYIHLYDPDKFLKRVEALGYDVLQKHVDREKAFLQCMLRTTATS